MYKMKEILIKTQLQSNYLLYRITSISNNHIRFIYSPICYSFDI